jgi:hypothetical protein
MEIQLDTDLSPNEETLMDMHSVLNVMNVVVYELMNMGDALKGCPEIDALTDATVASARTLRDPEEAYRQVANVDAYISRVRRGLAVAFRERGVVGSSWYRDRMTNMESIFTVLTVRAAELMARQANPDAWVTYSIADLKESLWTVFRAIEMNSRGSYRIVNNLARREEGDYCVFRPKWRGRFG